MSTLLIITASPRGDRSVTRTLTMQFADLWAQHRPNDTVLLRDVGHHPVPHVTEPWVAGAFGTPEAQTPESKAAISVSDQLVDELLSADRYVFAVPMYNFSVPSTFKAYIDQIIRPGRTFAVGPNGFEGLVKNRKALVILSSGGVYPPGSPMAGFLEPYLRVALGFIGVTELKFVTASGINQGDDTARQSREKAQEMLKEVATTW